MPKPTHIGTYIVCCQTMDEVHCAIAVVGFEVAKFEMPQTNAVTTSFLICPVARPHPERLRLNDGAKLQTFRDMAKFIFLDRLWHT